MTKQEAVSILEGEIIRCRMAPKINGCPMTEDWQKTIEVCEISIAAIKAQEERRWIPVTERLPDRSAAVLVFYESMRGTSAEIQVAKGWNIYGNESHWMPLPEPPKEEAQ